MYTAAVITISDKGYRGERVDTSGPNLVEILKEKGFDVTYTSIIPDEREMIREELVKCADELGIALVLTTGGTGFSPRDITPEAAMDIIERPTPGGQGCGGGEGRARGGAGARGGGERGAHPDYHPARQQEGFSGKHSRGHRSRCPRTRYALLGGQR